MADLNPSPKSQAPPSRPEVLVTGASGFFGGVLKRRLLSEGFAVTNIDLLPDEDEDPGLCSVQGDIRDASLLRRVFGEHRFQAVFHCAAMLAHDVQVESALWTSNVDGTRLLAEAALAAGLTRFVFISTNCLWAEGFGRPVKETDPPAPIEVYGRSKLQAEQELEALRAAHPELQVIRLRCPTIMDSGRLGLLAILFEFIEDGKKVWVVGDGGNRYQFIYAQDLATACLLCLGYDKSNLFHIGAQDVPTMRGLYESVIHAAGSRSRVASLPKAPTIALMKLAHKLHLSPLGPYHYQMIAESFIFDTHRIRAELGWRPTLTNQQMMLRAFEYYSQNRRAIHARTDASAHSKAAPMGIIRLLKWMS
jgi:nucleoside-diphosphate-sugar epimerase